MRIHSMLMPIIYFLTLDINILYDLINGESHQEAHRRQAVLLPA